jgi:hypothetical protein
VAEVEDVTASGFRATSTSRRQVRWGRRAAERPRAALIAFLLCSAVSGCLPGCSLKEGSKSANTLTGRGGQ